ncbi:MAG: DUF5615 family PIN-like protein [Planctomycetes bacterium]|nr:DUF5615 family PIN-like protein [Planctomycetota bacterium]
MRFLVDNSLSPRMTRALAEQGHEAVHVRDIGLATASDDIVFTEAAREDRVILAQDVDFGTILALRGDSRPSVVSFRCRLKSADRLLALLVRTLPLVESDLASGSLVVVQDSRIRVRRLPI